MNNYKASEIIDKIISENKNVLILDTCCLLDIIRCIQRKNLELLKSVKEIIQKFEENKNNFIIILPSLIKKEWKDNFEEIEDETKKSIKKHEEIHNEMVDFFNLISSPLRSPIEITKENLEKKLTDFSKTIIELSYCLNEINESKLRAGNRSINAISPAEKGKESYKDCVIFEEILYISDLLRKGGYSKKIVFATSNTKEYFLGNSLKEPIKKDIEKDNIEIVKSLSHGYYVVKS